MTNQDNQVKKNNSPNQSDNQGGRPYGVYLYTPEEMLEETMKYFKHCETTIIENSYGKKISKPKTISGLAKWLGVGKNYLREKLKNESFSGMLDYVYTNIENEIEVNALLGLINPTIASKNLSANFDWKDKTEQDTNINGNLSIGGILNEISQNRPNIKK